MPFGRTEEEKARREAEREQAEQRAAAARAREAYLNTPVGQAAQALERGDAFFQFHAPLSQLQGRASDWTHDATTKTTTPGATDTLGQIEELGWRLEHFASMFVETETSSRGKVLSSGEVTRTSGYVEGIYLFRRTSGS
jgi:hypothetical protein